MTIANGFIAGGVAAGIKGDGSLDLALVASAQDPVPAAGVFTRNRAMAAPVTLSRQRLASGMARAVVLNSGCANAGTGDAGMANAEAITAAVAYHLRADPEQVLACSTGSIGDQLRITPILQAVPELVATAGVDGGEAAAQAILTTDTHPKRVQVHHGDFTVAGFAKGAAMLRPDLATMLCVLTTDAHSDAATLAGLLSEAVQGTFNCLNVDGCESTNDSVLLLASGLAGPVSASDLGAAVEKACAELALTMAADAEGASKVVRIRVSGADDYATARQVGRAVADSGLVRASFFGADPNWGRVLAAAGTCPVEVKSISYQDVTVYHCKETVLFDASALGRRLQGDFVVAIHLGEGKASAEVITTDLTPEYVRFNGEPS